MYPLLHEYKRKRRSHRLGPENPVAELFVQADVGNAFMAGEELELFDIGKSRIDGCHEASADPLSLPFGMDHEPADLTGVADLKPLH